MNNVPAIACSLEIDDYKDRLAWIARVNDVHLIEHHREGCLLTLVYEPSAVNLVLEMVSREQACCPFLAFDVVEASDRIELTIRVPEDLAENAHVLLSPFLEQGSD